MKFILTGGEESDYKQALALLEGKRACFVWLIEATMRTILFKQLNRWGLLPLFLPERIVVTKDHTMPICTGRGILSRDFF